MHESDFLRMSNRWTSAASSRALIIRNVLRTLARHETITRIRAIDAFEGLMLARLDRAFRDAWLSILAGRVLMASNLPRDCLKVVAQRVHAMYSASLLSPPGLQGIGSAADKVGASVAEQPAR